MLNNVVIMGRLTKDPELRYAGSDNSSVTSFRLAVERDIKSSDGTKKTDFFDCVAWRGTAEFVSRHFYKGRMAIVSGRLQSRQWEDKDGNKRTAIEVVADSVYFGDSKTETRTVVETAKVEEKPVQYAVPNVPTRVTLEDLGTDEDELPF